MNRARAPLDPVEEANANQAIAADPAFSVFVTANAGSGKTKVLVDRIARLLLDGSKPSAFLCITYTKAAAAEMQRRLFERLGGWCVAEDAKLAEDLARLGTAAANLGRARALFAQALETPGGLKIQTIHAFCERLLARFPLEAGVPPGFEIADEARAAELLKKARAHAALAEDAPRGAFRRFAAQMGGDALDSLLDRLALRRADFHRFAAKHQGELFAAQALRDRHGVVQSADDFAAAFFASADWTTLRRAMTALASSSAVSDRGFAERLQAIFDCIDRSETPLKAIRTCFAFAFTTNGEVYKRYVTKALSREQPWLNDVLSEFADACARAREALNAIQRAEDAVAALALALKMDEAYSDAKHGAGVLDFDDLIERAQTLLRRSEAAPWVLYKLDGGLDHILIDEGQDTSPAQWDLIAPLQDEFFAGAGARDKRRTTFAVGDPKQSIYGFQGADPRRFTSEARSLSERAHDAGVEFVAPELRTSFRSAPEVLAAVDATLADKPLLDAPGRFDVMEHRASRENESGSVEVWPVTPRPAVAEAQPWDAPMDVERGATAHAVLAGAVAQRVKEMIRAGEAVWDDGVQRPMKPGDVLALVRTRGTMFRELLKACKRAGLPVAGADRMTMRDELAVEDCLALMRVALDPSDDLALACVLKGPWCNLLDDDRHLFPLAHGRRSDESLMSRLMASTDEAYGFARSFVQQVVTRSECDAFAFLSWALESPHAGGPSGWERVFARLGPEARDALEELLQRALKSSSTTSPTLQRFLHEIEVDAGQVKRELEAETGALRVMTVHGAKGLEAPVVILADTTGDVAAAPEDGLIFDDEAGPFVTFRAKDDDAATRAARAAHKDTLLSEHWRLLYVAMTRTKDRLIVCGPQFRSGEAEASWRLAVEEGLSKLGADKVETPFGEGLRFGAPTCVAATLGERVAERPLPSWAKQIVADASVLEPTAPSRAAHADLSLFSPRGDGHKRFRRGRLIHGLLQRLPDVDKARRSELGVAWLLRQGAGEKEAEEFSREAIRVIEDSRFAFVFGPGSRPEAPIIGQVGGRAVSGVVDRLAVDRTRVFVLDFKTDRPAPSDAADAPQAYVLQLALYREVLRAIFPDKTVSCALLWTEVPRLMELPENSLDAALAAPSCG